jgi:hypothetical protein
VWHQREWLNTIRERDRAGSVRAGSSTRAQPSSNCMASRDRHSSVAPSRDGSMGQRPSGRWAGGRRPSGRRSWDSERVVISWRHQPRHGSVAFGRRVGPGVSPSHVSDCGEAVNHALVARSTAGEARGSFGPRGEAVGPPACGHGSRQKQRASFGAAAVEVGSRHALVGSTGRRSGSVLRDTASSSTRSPSGRVLRGESFGAQ